MSTMKLSKANVIWCSILMLTIFQYTSGVRTNWIPICACVCPNLGLSSTSFSIFCKIQGVEYSNGESVDICICWVVEYRANENVITDMEFISGWIRVLGWALLPPSGRLFRQLLVCSTNRSQSIPFVPDTLPSYCTQLCEDWKDPVQKPKVKCTSQGRYKIQVSNWSSNPKNG